MTEPLLGRKRMYTRRGRREEGVHIAFGFFANGLFFDGISAPITLLVVASVAR